MKGQSEIGKILIGLGILLVVLGFIIISGLKLPAFGKLPGDISIKRDGFSFYFPLTTCIILSIIVTLLIWLVRSIR